MAKLSRLTVALHIYAWNATVKLWGTRLAGGWPEWQTPGGLAWLVALPCLSCLSDSARVRPTARAYHRLLVSRGAAGIRLAALSVWP